MLIGIVCEVVSEVKQKDERHSAVDYLKRNLRELLIELDVDQNGQSLWCINWVRSRDSDLICIHLLNLFFFFDPFLNAIPLRDSPRPTSRTGYRLQFCFSSFCHRCVIFGPEDFKRRAAECDLSWNDTLFPLLCESQDCMMVAPLQSWELLKPIKCIQKASLEKHPRACVCIVCVSMCRKTRPNYACGMSSLIYGLYIMHTLFITNIFDYLIYLRVPVWAVGSLSLGQKNANGKGCVERAGCVPCSNHLKQSRLPDEHITEQTCC